jgi:hypothetical protein
MPGRGGLTSSAPIVAEVEAKELPRAETVPAAPASSENQPASTRQPAPAGGAAAAPPVRQALASNAVSSEHQRLWSNVVHAGMAQSPVLRTVLMNTMLVSFTTDGGARRATLCCSERFANGAAKQRDRIAELFQRECGGPVEIIFQDTLAAQANSTGTQPAAPLTNTAAADANAASDTASPATDINPRPLPPRAAPTQISDHPLVKHALEVFSAKIVDVQPRRH